MDIPWRMRRGDATATTWIICGETRLRYHSHPRFEATPSITDIENQGNYQQLFKDVARPDATPPFVGLIVGTY